MSPRRKRGSFAAPPEEVDTARRVTEALSGAPLTHAGPIRVEGRQVPARNPSCVG